MHQYFVSYLHMKGSESMYGSTVVTVPRPVDSQRAIEEIADYLRAQNRVGNRLAIMGIFKLEG